jgi:hypothetical protein
VDLTNASAEHTASFFRIKVSTGIRRLYEEDEEWIKENWRERKEKTELQKDELKM